MEASPHVIPTPCVGVCALDRAGVCTGCLRTVDEIARWRAMSRQEQHGIMGVTLPLREQLRQSLRGSLAEHERLLRALHPLDAPPGGDGWNRSELIDLLPPGPPVEAAVLAGIVPREGGAQVILTRRTETLRQHGGQVGFPGGRTEPDDRDAVAAALRESQEEIALPPERVQALGYLDPFVTITGYRVMPVVAVIDPDFVPVAQPDEVAEVFEVPLSYLMDPANLHQVEIEHRGRIRHVLEYGWPGQRIWGATAAILYNLRRRLEQLT
jgi:predicted Fe-S protein YdhL (DUF1289 family)/8-oxo-dGTP pyrophosphatase MutT (NUDIX family)